MHQKARHRSREDAAARTCGTGETDILRCFHQGGDFAAGFLPDFGGAACRQGFPADPLKESGNMGQAKMGSRHWFDGIPCTGRAE